MRLLALALLSALVAFVAWDPMKPPDSEGIRSAITAQLEAFSTTMIGVMGGVYFGGFAIGCLIGPRW